MASTAMAIQTDRIEKGYAILREAKSVEIFGIWFSPSSDGKREYRATIDACTCGDHENREVICKHMLGGPLAAVAVACDLLRQAPTLESLKRLTVVAGHLLSSAPEAAIALVCEEHDRLYREIIFTRPEVG